MLLWILDIFLEFVSMQHQMNSPCTGILREMYLRQRLIAGAPSVATAIIFLSGILYLFKYSCKHLKIVSFFISVKIFSKQKLSSYVYFWFYWNITITIPLTPKTDLSMENFYTHGELSSKITLFFTSAVLSIRLFTEFPHNCKDFIH